MRADQIEEPVPGLGQLIAAGVAMAIVLVVLLLASNAMGGGTRHPASSNVAPAVAPTIAPAHQPNVIANGHPRYGRSGVTRLR